MVNIKLEITREVSPSVLSDFYRKEKQGKLKERYLILLHSKEGLNTREIAGILKKSPTTVSLWIRRFNEEGFEGILNKPKSGRPSKTSKRSFEAIKEDLAKSPQHFGYNQQFWTTKLLKAHIKKRYKTEYTNRHILRIFHGFGYTLIKPRPSDHRKSPAKKQEFKDNLKKTVTG